MNDIGGRVTVKELVEKGILERPMDGNHGEIHPKGDDFITTGVPFITAADIKDGRVDIRSCAFISEKQAKSLRKGFAKLGDVLLTHKATIGRTAIVDEIPDGLEWIVLTPQVTYYRVLRKDVLDPRYLKFYFDSSAFQMLLEAWSGGGSTRAYLGITKQLDLPIALLPIDEQRAIAAVLGALDDKIEQNRRTGRALEGLARATFKAWFVDFEPIKAKAAGQTSFPGIPPAAFAALPDRLTDSPIGPVPQGWEVKPIGDVVTVRGGGTPSTKVPEYWDGGTHFWATPKDLSGLQDPVLLKTERRITDAGAECISSGVLPENTVLLSSRAPVGYTALAKVRVAVNQGFIAMTCDGPLPPHYLLHWTRSALAEIKSRASGTTFPEISKSAFRPIPAVVPSPLVVAEFERFAQSLFDLIEANAQQSHQLGELRDYLLPKLLDGSVRVRI